MDDTTTVNKPKKTYHQMDFAASLDHRGKMKAVDHEDDGDTNCGQRAWNNPQRPGKNLLGKLKIIRRIEAMLTRTLRSARILRRVLET